MSLYLFITSCTKDAIVSYVSSKSVNVTETTVVTNNTIAPVPINQFKVVGYVTTWGGEINDIQFDKLTHINYAFLLPTVTGGVMDIENLPKLIALVKLAHSKNVKVLASVGGWNYGDDSGFISISKSDVYRKAFAAKLLAIINQYDLDGVDIDWETPKAGITDVSFTLLMQQLNLTIRSQGKLVTAAVPGLNSPSIQNEVFGSVDFLNIMAYDSFLDEYNHSPYSLSVSALSYWRGRGLPANKAVLGLPFYGRSRKGWDFTSYELYNDLLNKGADYNADTFKKTGYNGTATIKSKTNLALSQAGGVMIWELSGDAKGEKSLLGVIHQAVLANK